MKRFASTRIQKIKGKPDFKIILLDEADYLTIDAQNALRRIIEDFTEVTRFCLICNYITKIIEPLNSRCMKFRFTQIPKDKQLKRLSNICTAEGIQCSTTALDTVVSISKGDLRKALNLLQMASATKDVDQIINDNDVLFISDITNSKDIYESHLNPYLKISKSNPGKDEKKKIDAIQKIVSDGNTAHQIVRALHEHLDMQSNIGSLQKARLIIAFTEAQQSVLLGVADQTILQLLFAQIEDVFGI